VTLINCVVYVFKAVKAVPEIDISFSIHCHPQIIVCLLTLRNLLRMRLHICSLQVSRILRVAEHFATYVMTVLVHGPIFLDCPVFKGLNIPKYRPVLPESFSSTFFPQIFQSCAFALMDRLPTGLFGDRITVGARFFALVQTIPAAHPASYAMSTGSFPGVMRPGCGVNHPLPSSARVKERVELCLFLPSPGAFMACYYLSFFAFAAHVIGHVSYCSAESDN
jgi:hypothetical protein